MSQFNAFEKSVAYLLSFTPSLKRQLKWGYQFLNAGIHRRPNRFISAKPVEAVSHTDRESFFGYYDKSPESPGGGFTLFQTSVSSTRNEPSCVAPVSVILKNKSTGEEREIATSQAYNWQQGTRLQWIDEQRFVFNDFCAETGSYRGMVFDTKGTLVLELTFPVYDVYYDKYALTVKYERLHALRPDYGYRCHDTEIDLNDTRNDGVFFGDLAGNKARLLISLEELIDLRQATTMNSARHKVNHIMIAPSGDRFMFIHRWIAKNGKRYDRLVVADKDGSNLKIVADDEMVSHCCWYGDDTIIGFMRHSSCNNGFYRIDVGSGEVRLLSDKLRHLDDGHPSCFGSRMVFDSYPDRSRMKHLYIYDIEADTLEEIGEFYESLRFFEQTRCDLHPKWGTDGRSIFIDSVHDGRRRLYEIGTGSVQ
jgi:hypothetical protein